MNCCVCSSLIEHTDAIWQCPACFEPYHLKCAKAWAQACFQKRVAEAIKNHQTTSSLSRDWECKNCMEIFTSVPDVYLCYCGKESNPEFNPWLPPHSCGNVCGRTLTCGHVCNELCHPGRCPPCPRVVDVKCPCGKTKQTVRCSLQHLEVAEKCCHLPCLKWLPCGKHRCKAKCHFGPCPPCSTMIHQTCFCGAEERDVCCHDHPGEKYACTRVCGKPLDCGHHHCSLVCHEGECPPCPTQPPRACHCGQQTFDIPCTEPTPSCHQSCSHTLACGHPCSSTCHPPPCPACMVVVKKSCRCGNKTAEVPCSQELLCSMKCQEMRDCGRHRCGRRCCDGNHPPCTVICGKPLECHRHTCLLPCHSGACPPCPLTVSITCECGTTSMEVPCKDFRRALYPACQQLCQKPSHCHHDQIQEHACHPGHCPACVRPCGLSLPCGHACSAICHEGHACPPCHEIVKRRCEGGHEEVDVCCCDQEKPVFCEKKCGRMLSCGKHYCQLPCHSPSIPCETCKEKCPGRSTCSHPCNQVYCHDGPCEKCNQLVRKPCYCGKNTRQYPCWEVSTNTPSSSSSLSSSKTGWYSCGKICGSLLKGCRHGCSLVCHDGECEKECTAEVKVRCPCGKKKSVMRCCEVQTYANYDKRSVQQVVLDCEEEVCGIAACQRYAQRAEEHSKEREEEKEETRENIPSRVDQQVISNGAIVLCVLAVILAILLPMLLKLLKKA